MHPLSNRRRSLRLCLATAVAATLVLSGCMSTMWGKQSVSATLSGSAEIPATTSTGTGRLDASLDKDSGVLSWHLTYSGLSGPATAAHFHGPASAQQNAGVLIPIKGALESPLQGKALLTTAQVADLGAGMWYVNVHTAANPMGEIRGQLVLSK